MKNLRHTHLDANSRARFNPAHTHFSMKLPEIQVMFGFDTEMSTLQFAATIMYNLRHAGELKDGLKVNPLHFCYNK